MRSGFRLFLFTLFLLFVSTNSYAVEFYIDKETKQVFTEPSENREKLGEFRPKSIGLSNTDNGTTNIKMAQAKTGERDIGNGGTPVIGTVTIDGITVDVNGLPAGDIHKKWYDKLSMRGYTQFRYNDTISGDGKQIAHYADSSIGENKGFLLRRVRWILFGDVADNVYVYFQPDMASAPSGSSTGNFFQMRDAYADISFDSKKEYRVRLGQSKIPYGFENMQSSQNRLALDRNDGFNACCKDERDIGAYFYWAPAEIRERFRYLVNSGLKGSGDYGVFALGAYNGQGANRVDVNDMFHLVSRLTYPYKFANGQIFEASVQGITGTFKPPTVSAGIRQQSAPSGFKDDRVGLSAILYPQPLGFQAEWNWGTTPTLNTARTRIEQGELSGGYALVNYKIDNPFTKKDTLIPFFRWQYYDGGMKFEQDATRQNLNEKEFGIEYQPNPALEVVAMFVKTERTNLTNGFQADADLFRMQIQWNY